MKENQWARWLLAMLVAVASAWMLAACGGGDDDGDAETEAVEEAGAEADGEAEVGGADVDIAGVWDGTRSSDEGSTQLQFSFDQTADGTLSGAYHDTSGFEGVLAGFIDGDDIEFAVALTSGAPGSTWTFTGAVNATGTQLNGQMDIGAENHVIVASK
ncbi:MAG TPA: hypothetical protein DCM68_04245 [Verrucomicrobia bacterium]|nr:hypothetical protein [Verrucomicrobiota bacterium]